MINLQLVIALVLNAAALLVTAYVVPGFLVSDFTVALLAAIVIGVVNTVIRPVLTAITAPVNIMTLGLFTFVINAVILYLASLLVPGFGIDGWMPAIIGAVVLAVTATVLSELVKGVKKAVK